MTSQSPLEELFFSALALPPSERAAYLDEHCCEADLRAQVDRMLAAHEKLPGFLDPATLAAPQSVTADLPGTHEITGTIIAGKYKLLERIGEGGMGSVWMARQTEPVKRIVAVKLIKAGMDSKSVLARFDAERQALAMMDHPNIAKILDGGITGEPGGVSPGVLSSGTPYFVMELVKGIPITEYCDLKKLTPKERLELFVPVCQAIQHAHQKGIIHRDIKPSNVLIAMYDDRPVPKVIDFGVAKATGAALTEQTLNTGFGGIVGTPQYMSPEQATFNNLDIDTRSDVYSLGVLLYELLAGSPPFAKAELEKRGLLEILRVVREEEPPRPSTKLSTADALPSLSANRSTEPKVLTGILRNELDWIVMKALEKDRARRYETANGFAADVNRYLAGEAVLAHPPSTAYRLKKFVRRHKGQVIAASLVLFALLAGIAGTTVGLIEAKKHERLAVIARQAEAERAEGERLAKLDADSKRQEAERNLAFARKGNAILASVFAGLDPQADYNTIAELRNALRDNLVKAVKALEGSAIGEPLEVADMQNALGLSLLGLGEAGLAIEVLAKSFAICKEHLEVDHPRVLKSMNNLAEAYKSAGKLDKTLPLMEETLKLSTARLGADHPDTITAMNNLALAYGSAGKVDKELPLLEETLKLSTAKRGSDHPDTITAMNNLASAYRSGGKLDKALPLLEDALKLRTAKMGSDHPETITIMNSLAVHYHDAGKMDKALPLYEEILKLRIAKLGADHPHTLLSMSNLASGYRDAGMLDKALPLYEETLKLRSAKLGADHPDTLTSMNGLADGYISFGRMDKALPLLEETLKLRTMKLGADHPLTIESMNNLAKAYLDVKRTDKALPMLEETLKLSTAKLGSGHPDTIKSMNNLATCYIGIGSMDKALPLLEKTLKLNTAKLGADHPETLRAMGNLAGLYYAAGRMDKALPLLEQTLKLKTAKLGAEHPDTIIAMNNLATGYHTVVMLDKAMALYEETLRLSRAKLGADHPNTLSSMNNLARIYLDTRNLDRAVPLLEETLKLRIAKLGTDHPAILKSTRDLAEAYDAAGQFEKAEITHRKILVLVKAKSGGGSTAYANALAGFSFNLLQQEKWLEAETYIRECLAIRQTLQPEELSTFNAFSLLGGALLGQKKYAEAEALLLQGYEGMKQREKVSPLHGKLRIPPAIDRLIKLYTATNKPDEVKKWRAERAKYKETAPMPKPAK